VTASRFQDVGGTTDCPHLAGCGDFIDQLELPAQGLGQPTRWPAVASAIRSRPSIPVLDGPCTQAGPVGSAGVLDIRQADRRAMARRKADRSPERGVRRAETNAVAAYLTALRAPRTPKRNRVNLEKRRSQVEQWIAEEQSPIRQVELIQRRLDIDAQLAQADQADRLGEIEEAFVNVAASWAKRGGISAAALREVSTGQRAQAGWPLIGEIPMRRTRCQECVLLALEPDRKQ
jgi:hypothetical protein